jgi:GntR family transcriptional regulator
MDTSEVSQGGWGPSGGEPEPPIAFYLDPSSGAPVYRQLIQQVERALLLGYLREGDQLPLIREVTASLAVNPDTVQKAYRELEVRGIAEGRRGRGTFVVAAPDLPNLKEIARLRQRLADWLTDARAAGLGADMTAALFSAASRDEKNAPQHRQAIAEDGGSAGLGGIA